MEQSKKGTIGYGALFLSALVLLSVYLAQTVGTAKELNEHGFSSVHADYRYHFMVDIGYPHTALEEELLRGMQEGADAHGIVLEVNGYNSSYNSLASDFATWAGFTNPDAVIVGYPVGREGMERCRNVAGCTVYNGSGEGDFLYVGPDNYAQGAALAKRLAETCAEDQMKICLLYTEMDDGGRLRGFLDGIRGREGLTVTETYKSESGILNGMGAAEEVLLSDQRPDCFVCLDETLLTGAVRAVVDLNQVDGISVCGIGMSDEIARYIKNGLVDFSMDAEAYMIGKTAVEQLYAYLQKESEAGDVYTEFSLTGE